MITTHKKTLCFLLTLIIAFSSAACGASSGDKTASPDPAAAEADADSKSSEQGNGREDANDKNSYDIDEIPLERNGIKLHLDRTKVHDSEPADNILLVHGLTYSSGEFDLDYQDYSLVRYLAREGYNVWKIDIAGYGRSGEVKDGFMPDSDYAAKDIDAAVNKICETAGCETIDLLGWSWGTVTSSRYAQAHPEKLQQLVLYAPILTGLGQTDVDEPFHTNTWEHAASDFQTDKNGAIDTSIADPVIVDMLCSVSWRYDKDSSPNGGRKDLCVDESKKLIQPDKLRTPTLVICGDKDPYMNMDSVNAIPEELPSGSKLTVIPGAAHTMLYEKPYYQRFQKEVSAFCKDDIS